jgi:transposase
VLPARPAHPRDEAKGEVAVQIAERWILARMRNETHCSLDSLNGRIAELLEIHTAPHAPHATRKAARSNGISSLKLASDSLGSQNPE